LNPKRSINNGESVKIRLPEIRHNQAGFEALVLLHDQTKDCHLTKVVVDMTATEWLDADMCAAFGAILSRVGTRLNTIELTNVPSQVERILSKNGFLSNYGRAKLPDTWGTTIPYQRFDVKDDRYFAGYIEGEFVHRPEMPKMSAGLIKKFRESVFEIFHNAVYHSRTRLGIFSCGQYFPRKHLLDFSVVDLGVGIRRNVKEHAGLDLPPEQAIVWATQGRNTTRKGPIPGGLGLKLLTEFIRLNGGRVQIVSDGGYWCLQKDQVRTAQLALPFPGTAVSLEIKTSDTRSYVLSSEVKESDIF
jgi:hypothetical protein